MVFRHKILAVIKALGGFSLAQTFTKRGLQVLCYHGISLRDEHYFQPKLFMHEDTFRERMAYLKKRGYLVLSLDEALAHQDDEWRQRTDTSNNKAHNKELKRTLEMVHRLFRSDTGWGLLS